MELIRTERSPLDTLSVSFAEYVAGKERAASAHMVSGVPDYAFSMDNELRQRLNQIPHFQTICRKITATIETRYVQLYNQRAVAVGPNQFPEIYQMGLDCARRLGIGVPNIFIDNNTDMNAFTYASDTVTPMIVLYSGLVERMTPGELKCVIAHECGHIHNEHCVYQNVISELLSGMSGTAGVLLSGANTVLMRFWTRACEVTADRAALICCDSVQDAIQVDAKLASGGMLSEHWQQELDIASFRSQLDETLSNITRIYELSSDHPSAIRRIFTSMEFAECETFYSWRPELKKPGAVVRTKAETDERCKKIVNILNNQ